MKNVVAEGVASNPQDTNIHTSTYGDAKAELPREGILFCTQFPSLGIFIDKKVGFQKTKAA